MATTNKTCLPPLVDHLIDSKGNDWKEITAETARTDAQRILEALLVEFGVDATLSAMDQQGFTSKSYAPLVRALHREASARRIKRQ